MRAIRLAFFVTLAAVLVVVAAANRDLMTVSLLPAAVAPFAGGQWSLNMPAFLALFLAMIFGVLVGLVWEWLRELVALEREMGHLRQTGAAPHDDVLAILDDAKAAPATAGSGLPARR
jgi:uncharacterized integral membrane protein